MNEPASQRAPDDRAAASETTPPARPRRRRRGGNKKGTPRESRPPPRSPALQYGPLVLGGLVLGALFYKVWDVLAPPILALLAFYLMYPYRKNRLIARLMVTTALVLAIWLVVDTGRIVFPFFIAFILAYLFDPVVSRLERWRIPRVVVAAVLLVALVGMAMLAARFLVPMIVEQLTELIRRLPTAADRLIAWVEGPVLAYLAETLDVGNVNNFRIALFQGLADQWQGIVQQTFRTLIGVMRGFSTVFSTLSRVLELIAIPFVAFYLLKDFKEVKRHVRALIPRRRLKALTRLVDDFDHILSRYIRGQLLVAAITGLLTGLLLRLAGINYALILGLTTGTLNVIPYFGFMVSVSLGVLIAFFDPEPLMAVLKVVVIYAGVNLLESSFISPRIVGRQVGLHPVWVIISLLVFFHFFGFIGMLIAVPVTAVGSLFVRRGYQWYLHSPMYNRR